MSEDISDTLPVDPAMAQAAKFREVQELRMLRVRGVDTREIYSCSGDEYCRSLDLASELQGLNDGGVILDVGTGTGAGISETQDIFPRFRFVGLNSHELPADRAVNVPLVTGWVENLNKGVKSQMEGMGMWPPSIVLMKDVAHMIDSNGNLSVALEQVYQALPDGGKLLIHNGFIESKDKTLMREVLYGHVKEENDRLSQRYKFEEIKNGDGSYLRLTKPAQG